MRTLICFFLILFITSTANAAEFSIRSTGFSDNEIIPNLYSCNGKNISPALSWTNIPANTKSFALTLASPDWTTGFVYLWVLYNIPVTTTALAEGVNQNLPEEITVGNNYYYEKNYTGPCPPDNRKHHYVFTIYALDAILDLPSDLDGDDLITKINPHILKQTSLTGIFSH